MRKVRKLMGVNSVTAEKESKNPCLGHDTNDISKNGELGVAKGPAEPRGRNENNKQNAR